MDVALIGATGFVGSYVLHERLSRGHKVTAIARHPDTIAETVQSSSRVHIQQADATVPEQLVPLLSHMDAVISAYNGGWMNPDLYKTKADPRFR